MGAAVGRVLVVDDRAEARALVSSELEDAGFRVVQASDGEDAWDRFCRSRPDLVVSDLRMPRADGIELLRRIRRVSAVPVLLMSAYGDVPAAVAAMKAGAHEFLTFPEDLDGLIERARRLVCAPAQGDLERRIAGRSAAVRRVRDQVAALAPLSVPVLIRGERGTGRDRVARALHAGGTRADTPLVVVACSADTRSRPRPTPPAGVQGAVYLDEVGRLDVAGQARWLDALRARTEGGRIIASTSEDLDALARDGRFLPELAVALGRFAIALPPLRQRRGDIPILAGVLLDEIGAGLDRPGRRLQPSALAVLRERSWAGNVRELADVIEKLVAFSPAPAITGDLVRGVLREQTGGVATLRDRREVRQREELVALLEECGGNLAEVARRLDLSRGAVIYRARKYGLLESPGR